MNELNDQTSVDLASTAIVGLQGLMLRAIKEREGDNAAMAYLARLESGACAFTWSVFLTGSGAEIKMGVHSHEMTTWLACVALSHAAPSTRTPRQQG